MRRGERLPHDQAEIVFADPFVEYLGDLTHPERDEVLAEVVRLCDDPSGKHPLGNKAGSRLARYNTVEVLNKKHRVVYLAKPVDGVGLIEVLCAGPRTGNEVYDTAKALIDAEVLSPPEREQIWAVVRYYEATMDEIGLEGWDYAPAPAPLGVQLAAVNSGLLTKEIASLLSLEEINEAMRYGFSTGTPDPDVALDAALRLTRLRSSGEPKFIVDARREPRCGAPMPRAKAVCIRKKGHRGPHRARP